MIPTSLALASAAAFAGAAAYVNLSEQPARLSLDGGSVYVKPNSIDWKPSQFEGIQIKVLYERPETGELTCLLKWEPGTTLPFHQHPELEQSYVLEGSFYDHDGICRAGEFVWRHPESYHETKSDEGCILLAVYRKPNKFGDTAGFGVETGAKNEASKKEPALAK
jgi:quercetin dioxygenase-like cupin family protein